MRGLQRGLALGLLLALTGCSAIARRPDRAPTPTARPLATPAGTKPPVDLFESDSDAGLAHYFPNLAGRARTAPAASKTDSGAAPRESSSVPDLSATGPRHPHSKLKGDALKGVPVLPVALNVRAFPNDRPIPVAIARNEPSQAEARLRPRVPARGKGAPPEQVADAPMRSRDKDARPVRAEGDLAAKPEVSTDVPARERGRPVASAAETRILNIPEDMLAESAHEAASARRSAAARAERADTGPPPEEDGPPPLDVASSPKPAARAPDPPAPSDRRPAPRAAAPVRVARRSSSFRPEDLPPVQFPSSYDTEPDPARAEPPALPAAPPRESLAGRLLPRRDRDDARASDRDGRGSLAGLLVPHWRERRTGPTVQPQPARSDQDQQVRRAGATRKRPDYWFSDPEVRRAGATGRRPDYWFNSP